MEASETEKEIRHRFADALEDLATEQGAPPEWLPLPDMVRNEQLIPHGQRLQIRDCFARVCQDVLGADHYAAAAMALLFFK